MRFLCLFLILEAFYSSVSWAQDACLPIGKPIQVLIKNVDLAKGNKPVSVVLSGSESLHKDAQGNKHSWASESHLSIIVNENKRMTTIKDDGGTSQTALEAIAHPCNVYERADGLAIPGPGCGQFDIRGTISISPIIEANNSLKTFTGSVPDANSEQLCVTGLALSDVIANFKSLTSTSITFFLNRAPRGPMIFQGSPTADNPEKVLANDLSSFGETQGTSAGSAR